MLRPKHQWHAKCINGKRIDVHLGEGREGHGPGRGCVRKRRFKGQKKDQKAKKKEKNKEKKTVLMQTSFYRRGPKLDCQLVIEG